MKFPRGAGLPFRCRLRLGVRRQRHRVRLSCGNTNTCCCSDLPLNESTRGLSKMPAGGFSVSAPSGVEFETKITPIVVVSCIMAATGGLTFGYDIGISGIPRRRRASHFIHLLIFSIPCMCLYHLAFACAGSRESCEIHLPWIGYCYCICMDHCFASLFVEHTRISTGLTVAKDVPSTADSNIFG